LSARWFRIIRAGLLGGLVCLGIGGRIAMRLAALNAGRATHFGAGATVGILVIGAILGGLGAAGFLLIGRRLPGSAWFRGILFGSLFLMVLAPLQPPAIREEIDALRGHLVFAGVCFWVLFAAYGVVLARAGVGGDLVAARAPDPTRA
jgi:hypothetical protein